MSCVTVCTLFFFSCPSPRRPTARCTLVCGEARRLRSRVVVVFVVQLIDRYSYFCVFLVLLLYLAGSAQIFT